MNQSIINTKLLPFNATAFHNGEFVEVSEKDLANKWSVIFFSRGAAAGHLFFKILFL